MANEQENKESACLDEEGQSGTKQQSMIVANGGSLLQYLDPYGSRQALTCRQHLRRQGCCHWKAVTQACC